MEEVAPGTRVAAAGAQAAMWRSRYSCRHVGREDCCVEGATAGVRHVWRELLLALKLLNRAPGTVAITEL